MPVGERRASPLAVPLGARQPTGPEAPRRCAASASPAVAPTAASAFPKRARRILSEEAGGACVFHPSACLWRKRGFEAKPGESTTGARPAPRAMLGVGKAALPPPPRPPSGLQDARDKSSPISATGSPLPRPQEAVGKARSRPGETAVAAGWVWGTESRTSSRPHHSVAPEGLS